ncbi:MAG TPA: radical SAM protein [Elusimicrobia bacterium]|jgi:radical SAM superfamily enzyme YgiQ (UPF0313 family)|nr:radical SAM protein [Elusimicrobiota bacterium]
MRILLVNPWIYDFSAYDLWSKPLGLLYLASIFRNLDCEISLIDCLDRFHPTLANFYSPKSNLWGCGKYYPQVVDKPVILAPYPRRYKRFGLPGQIFCQEIEKIPPPDIILVTSGMTYWYPGVIETVNIIKQKIPKIPIILGGTYATLCTEHAKKYTKADFIFSGSAGEIKPLFFLIEKLTGKKFASEKIPDSFLEFPPPDYNFYQHLEYIVLRTSVGCPFQCSYCAVSQFSPFLQKKAENVVQEIIFLHEKYQVKNFVFYDDALLVNSQEHIPKILKEIKETKLKLFFHTPNGLHPRFISEETAQLLYQTNFVQPRLSLETTNPERQKKTGNKITNEEFIQAIKNLNRVGYQTKNIGVYLMYACPEENLNEVYESVNFVHQLGAKVLLVEYSPIPGTKDWVTYNFNFPDPLLQNNSIFPLYPLEYWQEFQKLKDYVRKLNQRLTGK